MKIRFDDLLEEKERRRCAPDWDASTVEEKLEAFQYFCRTYWHIRHPARGCIKFELSDAQLSTANDWLNQRYTIILKARQLGFSTLVGAFVVWATYFYPDRQIAMLSKGEREAKKLLEKSKYGFKKLPDWMKMSGPIWDMKATTLAFSNESQVESLPSGNDPARGESLWLVILDEWAFLPNPDQAWASVEATVDLGGRVIGLSTANGEGNIFHRFWTRSKNYGNGSSQWYGIFHPWWADGGGVRDDAWYEDKKNELPEWQLHQEYPQDPDEAFVKSGRPVFDIEKLRQQEIIPAPSGFLLPSGNHFLFDDMNGGPLTVWEVPQERGVYVIGADVAEGLEHGDFSSAHVIDVRNSRVVAHWHGSIDPDLFGDEVLYRLGSWYNTCLLGVESNNHGISTLKALSRRKYRNLFKDRPHNKTQAQAGTRLGFRTTQTSKPAIIDELGRLVRQEQLAVPDKGTVHELRTFVREGDGKMHGSPYDDRTMSLAISVWMMQFAFLPEYKQDDKPPPGTMGWLESILYKTEKAPKHVIGAHSSRRR